MKSARSRSLLISILYSPVGIGVGLIVGWDSSGEGYETFPFHAGVAAFLSFSVLWWLLMERRHHRGMGWGTAVGFLAGLLSHIVCWYLTFLEVHVGYYILRLPSYASSLGEPPIDLFQGWLYALLLSLWSWFLYGWITVPSAMILGALYTRMVRRAEKTDTLPV